MTTISPAHRTAVLDALATNTLLFPRWSGRALLWCLARVGWVTPFVLYEPDRHIVGYIAEKNGRYAVSATSMLVHID